MTTEGMGATLLVLAGEALEQARQAFRKGQPHWTVRRAQESVELALKGILRLLGVEFPKAHDVAPVLRSLAHRLPAWARGEVVRLAEISAFLAAKRGPAFYGDEARMIPPTKAVTKTDAQRAIKGAEHLYRVCSKLQKEWKKS